MTVRQDVLDQAFIQALGNNLRTEALREELIASLHIQLVERSRQQAEANQAAKAQREEMIANRAKYMRHKTNLLEAIRESGGFRSLYEDLKELEIKIARIDERLEAGQCPPMKPITLEEVRQFVNENLHRFEELLLGEAETVKREFQRRISSIVMKPRVDERGPYYEVSGDVALFAAPISAEQRNPLDLIGQLCKFPVRFNIYPYRNIPGWAAGMAA